MRMFEDTVNVLDSRAIDRVEGVYYATVTAGIKQVGESRWSRDNGYELKGECDSSCGSAVGE